METESTNIEIPLTEKRKKKWFFTLLLILTFLNCIIGAIVSLCLLLKIAFIDVFSTTPVIDMVIAEGKASGALYHLVKIVVIMGVFWGTLKMWKLQKAGFFIYLIMQLVLLVLPFAFLSGLGFWYIFVNSVINLIFLILFIMLYTLQLDKMK
jgi:hypothetical protein